MRVSFLIPSYNHSSYINYTLDSIFSDARDLSYEIVIIDDGSTDESKSKIESWRDLHPKVDLKVTYRENRGLSVTLNELVRQASGEIIRLCASDDAVYKGSTLKIINFFKESEALVLIGDAFVINDANRIIGDSAIQYNGGNILKMQTHQGLREEIVSNWSIPGPCYAMRRQVYDVVGDYPEDLLIEDWDFFLRVVALSSVEFSHEYFAYYRIHSFNTCKTTNINKRINNVLSQKTSAMRQVSLFSGKLKMYLILEIMILNLKVIFLKFVCFFNR